MSLSEIVQRGWDAVASGDFDALVADYSPDMKFVMPGQADVLDGREAFRAGRIPRKRFASASSPVDGTFF